MPKRFERDDATNTSIPIQTLGRQAIAILIAIAVILGLFAILRAQGCAMMPFQFEFDGSRIDGFGEWFRGIPDRHEDRRQRRFEEQKKSDDKEKNDEDQRRWLRDLRKERWQDADL